MGVAVRRNSNNRFTRIGRREHMSGFPFMGNLGDHPSLMPAPAGLKLFDHFTVPNGDVYEVITLTPPTGAIISRLGDPGEGGGTGGGTGGGAAPAPVIAGVSYGFQGGQISIVSVGSGADSGFHTEDGHIIPIGSIWTLKGADGNTETWTADAYQHSKQIIDQGGGGGGGGDTHRTDLVETISVDANGNVLWRFDPAAPQPYEIAYAATGDSNWTDLVPTPAPQSGSAYLNVPGGRGYTIVLHAGGVEVARTTYWPAPSSGPNSYVSTATPVPGATTGAATPGFFSNLFSSDRSVEWIGGVPNWITAIGAAILGSAVLPKLLKKI
jgi:hypothetical protein